MAATPTCFDVDIERALKALYPEPAPDSIRGHGHTAFDRCLVVRKTFSLDCLCHTLPCNHYTEPAIEGKHAMITGQVDAWRWRQGGQAGDEIE